MTRNFNLPPGCVADDIDGPPFSWVRSSRPPRRSSEESILEFRNFLKQRIRKQGLALSTHHISRITHHASIEQ
jgi:hypothetical protein